MMTWQRSTGRSAGGWTFDRRRRRDFKRSSAKPGGHGGVAEVVGEDVARTASVPENVGVVALDDIRLHDVPIGVDPPNGVESTTATPPWNAEGPDGLFPVMRLPVTR